MPHGGELAKHGATPAKPSEKACCISHSSLLGCGKARLHGLLCQVVAAGRFAPIRPAARMMRFFVTRDAAAEARSQPCSFAKLSHERTVPERLHQL